MAKKKEWEKKKKKKQKKKGNNNLKGFRVEEKKKTLAKRAIILPFYKVSIRLLVTGENRLRNVSRKKGLFCPSIRFTVKKKMNNYYKSTYRRIGVSIKISIIFKSTNFK